MNIIIFTINLLVINYLLVIYISYAIFTSKYHLNTPIISNFPFSFFYHHFIYGLPLLYTIFNSIHIDSPLHHASTPSYTPLQYFLVSRDSTSFFSRTLSLHFLSVIFLFCSIIALTHPYHTLPICILFLPNRKS